MEYGEHGGDAAAKATHPSQAGRGSKSSTRPLDKSCAAPPASLCMSTGVKVGMPSARVAQLRGEVPPANRSNRCSGVNRLVEMLGQEQ